MTILIMVITNIIGQCLTTPSAPFGIISFEFAFSPERAQEILNSWNPDAQLRAAFIQGLDFLFPLVYSVALGMGCILTASVLRSRRKLLWGLGVILAWGLALAALCDYIENIALVFLLFDRVQSPFPEIAGVCAVIKFTLIIIAAIYILYSLVIRIMSRPTRDLKPEP
ncbi:MAG: hypothetical protein A2Z71_06550 [Chloroflexi bacterium RBG_13_50_21]|nr:MAG: hypothetical protein A2Z71_06550 [Chloroflexi bacterium RBG_13_50_21]OGO65738.1 MAG: hypothetical protein A2030_07880 [Chloroflexi bacterium RBG_19FT_COMBO_50_10]